MRVSSWIVPGSPGSIIILVMRFMPNGIVGLMERRVQGEKLRGR
jgi:ABC-type branched-subunit amino acid transport system permease subunit